MHWSSTFGLCARLENTIFHGVFHAPTSVSFSPPFSGICVDGSALNFAAYNATKPHYFIMTMHSEPAFIKPARARARNDEHPWRTNATQSHTHTNRQRQSSRIIFTTIWNRRSRVCGLGMQCPGNAILESRFGSHEMDIVCCFGCFI